MGTINKYYMGYCVICTYMRALQYSSQNNNKKWSLVLHIDRLGACMQAHLHIYTYQYVRTYCHKGVTPSTKLKNKSEYHTSAIRNTRPSYPLASAVL